MNEDHSCSVVIPVYNSELNLSELIKRLAAILPTIASSYEVILVNDDSQDNSWQTILQLSREYAWLRGINLIRNFGQHNALLCGVRLARGDVIFTMDDDLQHPPEVLGNLLQTLDNGYDVVYGIPKAERHGFWRNIASRITKMVLQNAMGVETARQVSAFRVFRSTLCKAFEHYQGYYVNLDVLLTWSTTRFSSIELPHDTRKAGSSNYSFRKLINHALNMITGFTILPLQLASMMGFAFSFFGLLVLIYVLGRYIIQGGSVPGFPFLASIIAIFSGVQLFALGIIGEYLARMHFRLMERPPYVVNEDTANSKTSTEL